MPLRPIAHTCGFPGQLGRTFDVADEAGDGSDLLVRDPGLGRALAAALGTVRWSCVQQLRDPKHDGTVIR